jgi:hypothetical protein
MQPVSYIERIKNDSKSIFTSLLMHFEGRKRRTK